MSFPREVQKRCFRGETYLSNMVSLSYANAFAREFVLRRDVGFRGLLISRVRR